MDNQITRINPEEVYSRRIYEMKSVVMDLLVYNKIKSIISKIPNCFISDLDSSSGSVSIDMEINNWFNIDIDSFEDEWFIVKYRDGFIQDVPSIRCDLEVWKCDQVDSLIKCINMCLDKYNFNLEKDKLSKSVKDMILSFKDFTQLNNFKKINSIK